MRMLTLILFELDIDEITDFDFVLIRICLNRELAMYKNFEII